MDFPKEGQHAIIFASKCEVMVVAAKLLKQLFDLKSDCAPMEEIRSRIENDAAIKGANLAILIMAIVIASVGLNMNSTAVVIGAMLISPLMGGIVATGYGMASYDVRFIRRSLIKLFFQVLFSLLASMLYFTLSPISTASSEILARTEPTIWDVLIAFCGGIAGAVGNTRIEKSNVIPGVAIATALMPPLCTAGYGLAVHSAKYFCGALYLFFINSFFIALSSFLIFKLLAVPVSERVDPQHILRQKAALWILGIFVTVPSVYMAYQSVNQDIEQTQIKTFIRTEVHLDHANVVSYNLTHTTLQLDLVGVPLSAYQIDELQQSLQGYSKLKDRKLKVVQDNRALSREEVQQIITNKIGEGGKTDEGQSYKELVNKYYPAYQQTEQDKKIVQDIKKQAAILFPDIQAVQGGSLLAADQTGTAYQSFVMTITVKRPVTAAEAGTIRKWIQSQVRLPVLVMIRLADGDAEAVYGDGIVP